MMLSTASLCVAILWCLTIACNCADLDSMDTDRRHCLSLAIGENAFKIVDEYWDDKNQVSLRLSPRFLQEGAQDTNALLRHHVRCLNVLVSDVEGFSLALNVTKSVEEHVIVYSGKVKPPINLLNAASRPTVVLLENTTIISLYCPKESALGSYTIEVFSPGPLKRVLSGMLDLCPNPLRNQKLIFSASGGTIYIDGKLVGGYHVSPVWYLGKKFQFQPVFKRELGMYDVKKGEFVGRLLKTIKGEHVITSGGITRVLFSHFDYLPVHDTYQIAFVSRMARPFVRYDNVLLPFSSTVWAATAITVLLFAISFTITHSMYKTRTLESLGFHRKERFMSNFLLYPIMKLTEPDPLPWFTQKWSAGKMLTVLWAIFGLFLVMFYNSNLRAHLTAKSFEKSLDTIQDVFDNERLSWFPAGVGAVHANRLEAVGQTDTALYKIAKQVELSGTYFSSAKEGGVPASVIQDVITKRETALMSRSNLPQLRRRLKQTFGGERLYLSRENAHYYHTCFVLRKNHMMRRPIHNAIQIAVDMGLTKKWQQEFLPMELVLPQTSAERDNRPSTLEPMTFDQAVPPVIFLLGTIFTSLCVFAWEIRTLILTYLRNLRSYTTSKMRFCVQKFQINLLPK